MRFLALFSGLFLFLLGGSPLVGQSSTFYPIEKVQRGQSGYGRTVFEGTQVESFQVDILGVLQGSGPQQKVILARLAGDRIDRSGAFAGMSGSPVYIEDHLVGAVAYTFPFAKEPIVGITPIREMVEIFRERSLERSGRVNGAGLTNMNWAAALALPPEFPPVPGFPAQLPHQQDLGQLRSIATPLNLSGFSSVAIRRFASQLETMGLVPLQGIGGAGNQEQQDSRLEPGASITVNLVRGDMDVSAAGTLTHISGDRIYGFGHPFLGIGYTDLPVSMGSVLTVVPSVMTAQKLSATGRFVGSIRQDRATGVMGIIGEEPTLIPVDLRLQTSRGELKRFRFELVSDRFLTPFLATFAVYNGIVSSETTAGGQTLQLTNNIRIQNQQNVLFEHLVSDLTNSSVLAAVAAAAPLNFLLGSGFEGVLVEGIDLEIKAVEETREAKLEKLWVNKLKVKAGEEVQLTVFLRRAGGELLVEGYPLKIPDEVSPGPLKILVGDGLSLAKAEAESGQAEFIPLNLGQLIKAINNLKKNDRLYTRLVRDQAGAVVAGEGMPDLPPSLLALYGSEKTAGDITPISQVVFVEHELPAQELVLEGLKEIVIQVQ